MFVSLQGDYRKVGQCDQLSIDLRIPQSQSFRSPTGFRRRYLKLNAITSIRFLAWMIAARNCLPGFICLSYQALDHVISPIRARENGIDLKVWDSALLTSQQDTIQGNVFHIGLQNIQLGWTYLIKHNYNKHNRYRVVLSLTNMYKS